MAKVKSVVVAKFTHNDKQYVGKREVEMYEGTDAKTVHANVGMTLEIQREIRDALKVKYGLKTKTSGGKQVSYDAIESV